MTRGRTHVGWLVAWGITAASGTGWAGGTTPQKSTAEEELEADTASAAAKAASRNAFKAQEELKSARSELIQSGRTTATEAAEKAAKARIDAQEKNAKIFTASTSGLLRKGASWNLIGAANLNSLDLGQPSLAFGLEHARPLWTLMGGFSKNAASAVVEGERESDTLGQAVLNPALANFGFSMRGERRFRIRLECYDTCAEPADVRFRTSFAVYGDFAVSRSRFRVKDSNPDASAMLSPVAASFGLMFQVDGRVPSEVEVASIGSNLLMLAPYIGVATRGIGGTATKADLNDIFGSRAGFFLGGELGIKMQLGNLRIDPKVLVLASTGGGNAIDGLSGVTPYINFSYVLPWSVLNKKTQEVEDAKKKELEAEDKAKADAASLQANKKTLDDASATAAASTKAATEAAEAIELSTEALKDIAASLKELREQPPAVKK